MKSDIDIVVEGSRKIEKLLKEKLNSKGNGLVEQLKSADSAKITKSQDYVLRKIAHIRNGVVHRGTKLNNKSDFKKMVDAVIADLSLLPDQKKNGTQKKKVSQATAPTKKSAKKKPNTSHAEEFPPGFDPLVVNLKHIGSFGSDRYKNT